MAINILSISRKRLMTKIWKTTFPKELFNNTMKIIVFKYGGQTIFITLCNNASANLC